MRITDVGRSDGLTLLATTQRLSQAGIARSRLLPPGTLIMSIAATVGVPIVTGIQACIHDGFVAIENLRGIDQGYLLYVLKFLQDELRMAGQTGSQANVNSNIVKRILIPLPPISEQKAISAALLDNDRLCSQLERQINKKHAVKQGMMQQLLTGRVRLPGFHDPWRSTTLGSLGIFLKGRGVKRDDVRNSGIPCIRYGELYTEFNDYTGFTRSFVNCIVAASALPIQSGDLLFAGSGETREEIGKCVAYVGDAAAVAGGDTIVLRGSSFNPIYIATLANLPYVARQKARAGQGDAVVHVSSRALSAIQIEIPSVAEQDAIARVMVDADRDIAAVRARLSKARAIKAGMTQQLLTGRSRAPVETQS